MNAKLMSGRRVSLHAEAALSRHGRRAAWIVRERACHFKEVESTAGGCFIKPAATFKNGNKLKEDIRMRYKLTVIVMFLILASAVPVLADSFVGKITLVQVTSVGTKFYVQPKGLSLFAAGEYREALLHAFYHKANVSVGYTTIACPGGLSGTCGNVNFVSVDQSNFP